MAAFRILNVTAVNGKLVVEVAHLDSDGSTIRWYEEYDFQGRTGKKQIERNADGRPYLDNNELAPLTPSPIDGEPMAGSYYAPTGRTWKLKDNTVWLTEDHILSTIRSCHRKGQPAGYDGRSGGKSQTVAGSSDDNTYISGLLAARSNMAGRSYDL
jgi:hypothetical protein